jgi:hypothetical protein
VKHYKLKAETEILVFLFRDATHCAVGLQVETCRDALNNDGLLLSRSFTAKGCSSRCHVMTWMGYFSMFLDYAFTDVFEYCQRHLN